jgi:dihydroorotase
VTDRLTIARPDDFHVHLRDGPMLEAVTPATARHFGRALVMPNLTPPVATAADARAYRERIIHATPQDADFTPLMTLYLTESTNPDDLQDAAEDGLVTAVKLYPAGATTNSASGVRSIERVWPVLERMAQIDLPLCVHGEVTDPEVDIFDREEVFLERVLEPIRKRLPALRIVLEHVTTAAGVAYVRDGGGKVAGTLTVQHLMLTRNDLLVGGVRPHYYCLPVLKRFADRDALRAAATGGEPCFFLGTDSAPHLDGDKLSPCGCAGCYTAPVALAAYAQVFDEMGALDRLEGFAARHGAAFYGLPPNRGEVTLRREETPRPRPVAVGDGALTVFDPGAPLGWRVA